jgi:hypothetical protein
MALATGKVKMARDDLEGVEIRAGVNDEGNGFCTVVATTADRRMFLGQIEPDVARGMALQFLEVAEAADQDAAVLRCIRKLGLPLELAGAIVTELRNARPQE